MDPKPRLSLALPRWIPRGRELSPRHRAIYQRAEAIVPAGLLHGAVTTAGTTQPVATPLMHGRGTLIVPGLDQLPLPMANGRLAATRGPRLSRRGITSVVPWLVVSDLSSEIVGGRAAAGAALLKGLAGLVELTVNPL
jgi:hypothetical protein